MKYIISGTCVIFASLTLEAMATPMHDPVERPSISTTQKSSQENFMKLPISMIFVDNEKSFFISQGKRYQTNDKIGNNQVVSIKMNGVILSGGGSNIFVPFLYVKNYTLDIKANHP